MAVISGEVRSPTSVCLCLGVLFCGVQGVSLTLLIGAQLLAAQRAAGAANEARAYYEQTIQQLQQELASQVERVAGPFGDLNCPRLWLFDHSCRIVERCKNCNRCGPLTQQRESNSTRPRLSWK
jgi:hypothetical protein